MAGIVRKIDPVGRVVIPMEIRKLMGLKYGDPMEIVAEKDRIVLKKFSEMCVFCNQTKNLKIFKDKKICDKCLKELALL